MSDEIELPNIYVNYKKINPYFNNCFYQKMIDERAGAFYPDFNAIVLSYGKFTKHLCRKYNLTIEQKTCKTISHEIMHWVLFNEVNEKVCSQFDNIAEKLAEYGVY